MLFGPGRLKALPDCGLIAVEFTVPGTLSRAVQIVDGG